MNFVKLQRRVIKNGFNFHRSTPFLATCPYCFKGGSTGKFTNIQSIYHHQCDGIQKFRRNQIIQKQSIISQLCTFISRFSISLSAVTSREFRDFCDHLSPQMKYISKSSIRQAIFNFAQTNFLSLNQSNFGDFGSLLLDGTTKLKHKFVSILIWSPKKVHYIQTFEVHDEDAKTLVNILIPIINHILNNRIEILASCTDHGSAYVKAFNLNFDGCAQLVTHHFFFHIGCFCHSLNLLIKDIVKENKEIIHFLDQAFFYFRSKFTPTLSPTRWGSYNRLFQFAKDNGPAICERLRQKASMISSQITTGQTIQEKLKILQHAELLHKARDFFSSAEFIKICEVMDSISNTITQFESYVSNLTEVFPAKMKIRNRIQMAIGPDQKYLPSFLEIFDSRFLADNNENNLAIAAYSFTIDGKDYIQKLNQNEKDKMVDKAKNCIIPLINKLSLNQAQVFQQFDSYLQTQTPLLLDDDTFWDELKNQYPQLEQISIRMRSLPASEALVEQLFSHLGNLYGKKNSNLSVKLLDGMTAIRMESYYCQ